METTRRVHRRLTALAALLVALLVSSLLTGSAAPAASGATSYRNPVSRGFADTFADPSVIRGKDGYWYAYGTSDPLREGEKTPHRVPIARSRNLVDWTHVADAFTDANRPAWAAPDAGIWAPDIRYVNGQYRLYYVVTRTTVTPEADDNAIGMATAPTPAGPWTDSGAPVVGPRPGSGGGNDFLWTFDPSVVTDRDGSQWIFYGSYYGGVFVRRLNDAGTQAVGEPTMVAIDNKFEGAYVVRHGAYWYLFASTANCCAGPTTGYSVQVGRARDLRGPYVDRGGSPLTASRAGGTPVLVQNGNRWIGAGHNAVVTDLAGQDWIAYHAIDRADPYLDGTDGINQRPMLLDRLDWVKGWPQVRAGLGPSDTAQRSPATGGATGFAHGIPRAWHASGAWSTPTDAQSGRYARSGGAGAVTTASGAGNVRVEGDMRSAGAAFGLVAGRVGGRTTRRGVTVVVDPATRTITLSELRRGHRIGVTRAVLPKGFDPTAWHSVSLELRGRTARTRLTHARLGDPLADLTLRLRRQAVPAPRAGAWASGAGVGVDNLSAQRASRPPARTVRDAVPTRLDQAASDEFTGSSLAAGWQWVRPDAQAHVTGGSLRWPTQAADLVGPGNDAGVLLRQAPRGDWAVETKVSIDLGTTTVRNYQQAGLIAYVGDDLFTRLSHVAIWNTRQTEFGKEMPYAGRLSYGGTIVGPPADTTWLRLTHHLDQATGEHLLRAWTSRDGTTWVRGGVWTLPAGADLRVGLISHGGAGATADFDYFRTYR
ncbi:MAG: family 43 glycosylhydrolase [Actinomycetes bacterium]